MIDGLRSLGEKLVCGYMLMAAVLALVHGPGASSAAEGGNARAMKVGENTTLSLAGNPSTGFRWTIDKAASRGFDLVSVEEVSQHTASGSPPPAGAPLVGAPRPQVWRVTALRAGRAELVFVYLRPWETVAPARREAIAIEIAAR